MGKIFDNIHANNLTYPFLKNCFYILRLAKMTKNHIFQFLTTTAQKLSKKKLTFCSPKCTAEAVPYSSQYFTLVTSFMSSYDDSQINKQVT